MPNRIRTLELIDRSLHPASAEVWVRVEPEEPAAGLELRGRLMGPRCRYSNTVEVSYPLRPLKQSPPGLTGLLARVVVTEASLWDPESPFYYEGPVELWQDGRCVDRATVRHGLRQAVIGPRGLIWNGQPLTLRGRSAERLPSDAEAQAWRADGVNLLLAAPEAAFWDLGDRFGFVLLGRLRSAEDEARRLPIERAAHPCHLGWLLEAALGKPLRTGLVGRRLEDVEMDILSTHFIVCAAAQSSAAGVHGRPLLMLGKASADAAVSGATVLGAVEE
jgi:hypothetical protein